jgi:Tol biopolymer transport system component
MSAISSNPFLGISTVCPTLPSREALKRCQSIVSPTATARLPARPNPLFCRYTPALDPRAARRRQGGKVKAGRVAVAAATVLAVLCFVGPASGATAERISVSAAGEQANDASFSASMSADGRYTAFDSLASNLVPGDTNNGCDVFVRDNSNGTVERVSVSSTEAQVDTGFNCDAAISADGRFVAFQSDGAGLVPNDTSTNSDVFVRDRLLGTTDRASVGWDGETPIGNGTEFGNSLDPAISTNGRFVAFTSSSRNLIPGREIFETHVYVRDRLTGTTEVVSERPDGESINGPAAQPSLSDDGRYVAFVSFSEGLAPGDDNLGPDVFVRDRDTGTTTAASVSSTGALPQYVSFRPQSEQPSISADGRYVAFKSNARDLVAGDDFNDFDVFVRDRVEGTTRMASVTSTGEQAFGGDSAGPSISADGNFVAFHSSAGNLSPGGGFGTSDIIVYDVARNITKPITLGQDFDQDDGVFPSLTADGGQAAFTSRNNDLVVNDTNGVSDVFRANVTWGDDVPPALSLPQFPIVVPADRPQGAVVTYMVTATDTDDPSPTVSCTPASGSVFPIGDTTVTCKATDASGNVATGSFSVHVQGVDEQLGELKSMVDTFDMDRKVRADLQGKLTNVRTALDSGRTRTACSVLKGFVNEASDESGKGLTVDLAAVLIERANRIRGVLACS